MPRVKTDQEKHPERYFISSEGHVRDRIILNESPEIPKEGMFISLNGYSFLAKPGVEIDLPRPVRLMLDTRIKTEITHGKDGETYTRHIPRITYRMIKEGCNLPSAVIDAVKTEEEVRKEE